MYGQLHEQLQKQKLEVLAALKKNLDERQKLMNMQTAILSSQLTMPRNTTPIGIVVKPGSTIGIPVARANFSPSNQVNSKRRNIYFHK